MPNPLQEIAARMLKDHEIRIQEHLNQRQPDERGLRFDFYYEKPFNVWDKIEDLPSTARIHELRTETFRVVAAYARHVGRSRPGSTVEYDAKSIFWRWALRDIYGNVIYGLRQWEDEIETPCCCELRKQRETEAMTPMERFMRGY